MYAHSSGKFSSSEDFFGDESKTLDRIQTELDVIGWIPGIGDVADGANGLISLYRKDYVSAGLDLISMVPLVGDVIGKGGKVAKKVAKHSDDVIDAGKQIINHSDDFIDSVKWTNHGFKHFPSKNKPWRDIVKSTKQGPAKYSTTIKDIEKFEREAWSSGKQVVNGKDWRVKEFESVIGASGGKETRFIRIENSNGTIHGHPITENEYKKLLGE